MNTYIAIRPYIAQQIIEHLKKLPYNEVSGLINEIEVSMNYPVQLNWNQPVGDEEEEEKEGEEKNEKKEKQRKPIGFRCIEEVEGDDGDGDGDGDGEEGEPDEPTIVCKPEKQRKNNNQLKNCKKENGENEYKN